MPTHVNHRFNGKDHAFSKYRTLACTAIIGDFGLFMQAVQRLQKSQGAGSRDAGMFMSALRKRQDLLAATATKFMRLFFVSPAIADANRTIMFTQTQHAAKVAADCLRIAGHTVATLDGTQTTDVRAEILADFEDGEHDVVASPRLLDEGINVPEADLALVLSAYRSRRQMIQRLGRVLRLKDDGRLARLAVFFIEDTIEDPDLDAHEGFLAEVQYNASDCQVFRSDVDAKVVVDYLRP